MSKAPFLVNLVLSIVWHWTDTYESVLYIKEIDKQLVIARLPKLFATLVEQESSSSSSSASSSMISGSSVYTEGTVMMATFLVVLPLIIIYFFLQNQFTQGVERSGIVG